MSGRRRAVVGLLVAAVALSALLATWAVRTSRALAEANADLVELTAYLAQMSTELRSTRADADLLVEVLGVVDDVDVRLLTLRGGAGPDGASGRILAGEQAFVLLTRQLPEPGPGRAYQVWVAAPGAAPTAGGTFSVNPFGMATLVIPARIGQGAFVSVTEEPDGGSLAPTGPPILTTR